MKWLFKISSYPSFQNLIGQIEAQRYNDNCTENLLSSHMVMEKDLIRYHTSSD